MALPVKFNFLPTSKYFTNGNRMPVPDPNPARLGSPTGPVYTPGAPGSVPLGSTGTASSPAALKENWSLISLPKDIFGLGLNKTLQTNLGANYTKGSAAIGAFGTELGRQQPGNLATLNREQNNVEFLQKGGMAALLSKLTDQWQTGAMQSRDWAGAGALAASKAGRAGRSGVGSSYDTNNLANVYGRLGAATAQSVADRRRADAMASQDAIMRTFGVSAKLGQDYAGNLLAPTEAMSKFDAASIGAIGGTIANTNAGTMFGADNGLPIQPWTPPLGWQNGGGGMNWGGSSDGGSYFAPRDGGGYQPQPRWQPPAPLGAAPGGGNPRLGAWQEGERARLRGFYGAPAAQGSGRSPDPWAMAQLYDGARPDNFNSLNAYDQGEYASAYLNAQNQNYGEWE